MEPRHHAPTGRSGGGYSYKDSAISGFSLTHMSGPGCAVYGDIPILPTVGAIGSDPPASTAPFSHSTEVASPGTTPSPWAHLRCGSSWR